MSLIISGKDSSSGQFRYAGANESLVDESNNNILLNQSSMLRRQWGYATAHQTLSTDMDAMMMLRSFNVADSSSSVSDTSSGVAFRQQAGAGSNCRWETNTSPRFHTDTNLLFICKFALQETSSIRFFLGPTTVRGDTAFSPSDDPAATYLGLMYSTSRGDTNWQFVINPDAATQTVVDSGVAVSTNVLHFQARITSGSNKVVLYDANFDVLASHTFGGTLTSGNIYGGNMVAVDLATNAPLVDTYWIEVSQD